LQEAPVTELAATKAEQRKTIRERPPPTPRYTSAISRLRTVTPLPRLTFRTKALLLHYIRIKSLPKSTQLAQDSTLPASSFSILHYTLLF